MLTSFCSFMKERLRLFALILSVVMQMVWVREAEGEPDLYTWRFPSPGSYNWCDCNWNSFTAPVCSHPQFPGDVAELPTLTSIGTVSISINSFIQATGGIDFDASKGNYVITGPNTLIYDSGLGGPAPQLILDEWPISANHPISNEIQAPIQIDSHLQVKLEASGCVLIISGPISSDLEGLSTLMGVDPSGGTLILSGLPNTKTYTGDTTIGSGTTIKAGSTNSTNTFPINSTVNVNSGPQTATLDLNNFNQTIGALEGSGPVKLVSATLTTGGNNADTTYSGTGLNGISGMIGGGLIKQGTGKMTLTGSNFYIGDTTIKGGGTLQIYTVNSIGTGDLIFDTTGGTLQTSVNSFNFLNDIMLNGPATFLVDSGITTELHEFISGSYNLTKTGPGTLKLSHTNTYMDGTSIYDGTIQIATAGNLSTDNHNPLIFSGITGTNGNLDVTGTTTLFRGIELLNSNTTYTITVEPLQILTQDNSLPDDPFFHYIFGSGALTKAGTGTLVLQGSQANNYSGGTIITGGTVSITDAGKLGGGALTFNGSSPLTLLVTGGSTPFTPPIHLLTSGIIDVATGQIFTSSGSIDGVGLEKQGAGTLIISGNINSTTYTGTTTITQGTLQFNTPNAQSVGAIVDNDTLIFNETSGTFTCNGAISGSGMVTKQGGGTLIFTQPNSYNGATTIAEGTLLINNGANLTSGPGQLFFTGTATLQNLGAFTFNNQVNINPGTTTATFNTQGPATLGGVITGFGNLTKQGGNTLTLTGNDTYMGQTQVSAGTLVVKNINQSSAIFINLGATLQTTAPDAFLHTAPVANNGTFDLQNNPQTIGSLAGNVGSAVVNLGSAILITGFNNSSTTYAGDFIGTTGGLTKTGTGTMTLTGPTATYTGPTLISGGTLQAGATNTLAPSSAFTVSSGANLSLENGPISYSQIIGSLSGAGTVKLGTAILTTGGDTTSTLFSGNFIGTTGGLTKTGTGTMTLTGPTATYRGPTLISGGTLLAGATNTLAELSDFTVSSGANLSLENGLFSYSQIIGSLSGAGTVKLGTAILTTGGNNHSTLFSGNFIGTTGGLTKTGTGTMTLTGPTATYNGPTLISGGTLLAGATNTLAQLSDFTVSSGATLSLENGPISYSQIIGSLSGAGTVKLGTAILTTGGNNHSTLFSGNFIGTTGGLTKTGTGTMTLTGPTATYRGPTLISDGILLAGATNTLAPSSAFTVSSGAELQLTSFPQTIGSLSGAGTVDLGAAPAILTTGGNNSSTLFSGNFIGTTGGLTKTGSGTMTLTGPTATYTGPTLISGGTLLAGATDTLSPNSDFTVDATLSLTDGTNSYSQTIGSLAGSGSVNLGSANLTTGNNNNTTFSGTISGTGGSLTKQGTGTMILTGRNTYTGGTFVNNGTLQGDTTSIPDHGITTTSPGNVTFNQTSDGSFTSLIQGTGTLTKTGGGTLTLTNSSNNQAGGVIINQGVLNFIADFNAAPVGFTVNNGGTLGGTATLTGDINVLSGGTLTPALPGTIGTLADTGNVNFFSGSNYRVDFNMTTTQADRLNVTGGVTIQDGAILTPYSIAPQVSSFTQIVLQASSGITDGTFTINNPYAFLEIVPTYTPTTLSLTFEFVPFTTTINCGNPGRVAAYLDEQSPLPGTDFAYLISLFHHAASVEDAYDVFDHLHPALFSAFSLAEESATQQLRTLLTDRASELYFSACDCNMNRDFCEGFWISALGDFMKQDRVSQVGCFYEFPFTASTGGAVVGWDYALDCNINSGACAGYTYTGIEWDFPGEKGWTDSYFASLYASSYYCRTLFDLSLIGAYNLSHGDRLIEFVDANENGINRRASHSHNSWLFNGHVGAIYPIFFRSSSLSPFANLDYYDQYQNSFHEHGASSLNLIVDGHRSDLLRSEAGARLAFSLDQFQSPFYRRARSYRSGDNACCRTQWLPSLSASYIREWRFADDDYTSRMQGGVGTFEVIGLNPNRGFFSPAAELLILDNADQLALTLRYQGEFSSQAWDQNFFVRLSYDF